MIPINILLFVFLFFMLLVLLFTFFNVYHLVRYGRSGAATILLLFLYLIVIFSMIAVSLLFIAEVDWSATVDLLPRNAPPLFQ